MISKSSEMVSETPRTLSDPQIEDRIEFLGSIGTIKYIGPVEGYAGTWLGIDWDDESRGKHNGTVNCISYFQARHAKSGSFVKPEKVNFGRTAVDCITSKYGIMDELEKKEQLIFKNQTNAPFLEMVGFERIAKTQSNYDSLTVVDLRQQCVNSAGNLNALRNICPNIRDLDLAKNLFTSWMDIFEICLQLDHLETLDVSQNHLEFPANYADYNFPSVKVLECGHMNLTWNDVLNISKVFNNLEELRLPFNRIVNLDTPVEHNFKNLELLCLSENAIKSWPEIVKLDVITSIKELYLEKVQLCDINIESTNCFANLKKLQLGRNLIDNWKSISELNKLKSLEELRIDYNPFLATETSDNARQFIIARIANLKVYRGSTFTDEIRRGAEYDYLKKYGLEWLSVKDTPAQTDFLEEHNRYLELIKKYGALEESELKVPSKILSDCLISLNLSYKNKVIVKKLPPTLTVQKLSMFVKKLFKIRERPVLTCICHNHDNMDILLEDEMKEIGYYSIEAGDTIIVNT